MQWARRKFNNTKWQRLLLFDCAVYGNDDDDVNMYIGWCKCKFTWKMIIEQVDWIYLLTLTPLAKSRSQFRCSLGRNMWQMCPITHSNVPLLANALKCLFCTVVALRKREAEVAMHTHVHYHLHIKLYEPAIFFRIFFVCAIIVDQNGLDSLCHSHRKGR